MNYFFLLVFWSSLVNSRLSSGFIQRALRVCSRQTVCNLNTAQESIALTREISKNRELESILKAKKIQYNIIPCISHSIGEDRDSLPYALKQNWSYIVVTSPEAATVLVEGFLEAGSPQNLQIASIGQKTSSILVQGGLTPIFEASCSNAATLIQEIPTLDKSTGSTKGNVLYPASLIATSDIECGLNERGYQVTRLNTYSTEPAVWDDKMYERAKQTTIVTFASPSAVRVWADRVNTNIPAVCIGLTTRNEAEKLGFRTVASPNSPGLSGLADLILEFVTKRSVDGNSASFQERY